MGMRSQLVFIALHVHIFQPTTCFLGLTKYLSSGFNKVPIFRV